MFLRAVRIRPVRLWVILALALSFALSRLAFWMAGLRYNTAMLDSAWQFLDVEILRTRLLAATFHLHAQPPGFNFFLGAVLKLCPERFTTCFHAVYLFLGFLLYCALFFVLRLARFSRPVALLLAFLFILGPGSILYENWLMYTYPVAALLALAAWALRRFELTARPSAAGLFLSLVAAVCLIRSSYHIVFLLACAVLVLIPRGTRRPVAVWAGAIASIVLALCLKNLILFGFFGSSSWAGMNLCKMTRATVDQETLDRLAMAGKIPEMGAVRSFAPLADYPPDRPGPFPGPDVPELRNEYKSDGRPNFNHIGYVAVSRAQMDASMYVLPRYVRRYLAVVFQSWLNYARPSWDYRFLGVGEGRMHEYVSILSALRLRGWVDLRAAGRCWFGVERPFPTYLSSLLFVLLVLICAVAAAFRGLAGVVRRGSRSGLCCAFMALTVLYVAVLGNAMECGENHRFRVETDPLIFLLAVITIRRVWRTRISGWAARMVSIFAAEQD